MLSGTAIAALQRQADDELLRRLELIRLAQIEMAQLVVAPAFIGNLAPDGNKSVMAKGPDPRLAAEKLLRSVLPEDLCVSLSAINECEVQGKKHRYKIFKGQKTHCIQGDKTFSCCIGLEDTQAPDTDRIVAEYLLIKNNEEEYLKTANLTQIAGPRDVRSGAAIREADENDWVHRNVLAAWPLLRFGDTVHVRYPDRYDQLQIVAQECFRLLFGQPPFSERRYPELRMEEILGRFDRQVYSAEIDQMVLQRGLPNDEMRRYLMPAVEQLRDLLAPERVNIIGFWRYGVGDTGEGRIVSNDGKMLTLLRGYDPIHNLQCIRLCVEVITPR
jgi:hypothetical protein